MRKKFQFPCAAEYVKQGQDDNCRTTIKPTTGLFA